MTNKRPLFSTQLTVPLSKDSLGHFNDWVIGGKTKTYEQLNGFPYLGEAFTESKVVIYVIFC